MPTFVLIDLAAQQNQVRAVVGGQDPTQILAWLRQFGDVQHVPHPLDQHLYGFVSRTGVRTGFRLTDHGHIIILGPHTTHTQDNHDLADSEMGKR
jgi:hypothetical protein